MKNNLKHLLVSVIAAAMCLGAHAQTRYVLSVGAQTAAGGLHFLDSDARLIADVFKTSDANIKLLSSEDAASTYPTISAVQGELDRICSVATPKDSVWLYFSTHGTQKNGDGKSYLVLPRTKGSSDYDLLSVADIRNRLKTNCRAGQVAILIDACNSGSLKAAPLASKPEAALGGAGGIVTIAGCGVNESSLELADLRHGLFTFFLVKGLAGEAKASDGRITLNSLASYVKSKVREVAKARAHEQTPVVIVSRDQGNMEIEPGNPAVQATLPSVNPTTVVTQPSEPLPPGIVLSIQGVDDSILSELTEASITNQLVERRYPVFGTQQSEGFEALLRNRDTVEAAKQAARMNGRFLLRLSPKFTVTRTLIGSTESMSCECTLSLQLIDSDGRVLLSDSGVDSLGTPAKGPGFSELAAKRAALQAALQNMLPRLMEKLEKSKVAVPK